MCVGGELRESGRSCGLDVKSIARRASSATCGGVSWQWKLSLQLQHALVLVHQMFRLAKQRAVCLACQISSQSQRLVRQVSTSSAINRGIRASQDDGGSKRGGRDRSRRPVARPRKLSDTYNVQPGSSRDQRSPRTSFSRRDEGADSRQTRSSQFGSPRNQRSSKPSFSRRDDSARDSRLNKSSQR